MGAVFNTGIGTVVSAQTGRISADIGAAGVVGVARLPTDPLFYADLTLQNVVAGSRYRITHNDTGAELATGVVAGSGLVSATITGLPCYANPMQANITVRNASGATKYKVFDTAAFMVKAGASAYILQQID